MKKWVCILAMVALLMPVVVQAGQVYNLEYNPETGYYELVEPITTMQIKELEERIEALEARVKGLDEPQIVAINDLWIMADNCVCKEIDDGFDCDFREPIPESLRDKIRELPGVAHAFIMNRYHLDVHIGKMFTHNEVGLEISKLLK
jgi:hypothetical protein